MKSLVITSALALINKMPFTPAQESKIKNCVFSQTIARIHVTNEEINQCIKKIFPGKFEMLVDYNGKDKQRCAFYPYKATIRYYGKADYNGTINPCFLTPYEYKTRIAIGY